MGLLRLSLARKEPNEQGQRYLADFCKKMLIMTIVLLSVLALNKCVAPLNYPAKYPVCIEGASMEVEATMEDARDAVVPVAKPETPEPALVRAEPKAAPAQINLPTPPQGSLEIVGPPLQIDKVTMPALSMDSSLASSLSTSYEASDIPVAADDTTVEPASPLAPTPRPIRMRHDRVINQYRAITVPPGVLTIVTTVRPTLPFLDSGSNFFGLDVDPAVGFGLRTGVYEGIDLGVMRVRGPSFSVYEVDARVKVADQSQAPMTLTIRGGATMFAPEDRNTSSGVLAEIIVERVFWDRVVLLGTAAYHGDSTSVAKGVEDTPETIAFGGAADIAVYKWLYVSGDAIYAISGYRKRHVTFAVGPKILSGNFSFSAHMTSNNATTMDGLIPNTTRGELSKYLIGVNITGEIPFL